MTVLSDLTSDIADAFTYDPCIGELRWAVKRKGIEIGDIAGSLDCKGYRRVEYKGRAYKVHRIAWLLARGEWPSKDIDHINGDRADNRIENLREASKAENAQNYPLRANSSGLHGVCWNKRHKKWRAHIRVDGRQRYLGSYDTPEGASRAYLAAKQQIHTFQPIPRDIGEAA